MNTELRKFSDCYDLQRLKYFTLDGAGRLIARKDEVGPVIDFHTHLCMTFVFAPRLNLMLKTGKVDYYFPYRGTPVNLDVYSAQCFTEADRKKIVRELVNSGLSGKGYVRSHTIPNHIEDMDRMGVTHSVTLAVEYPWGLSDNTGNFLKAITHEPRIIGFGSVHPYDINIEKKIDRCVRLGAVGIKLHPAQQLFNAANKRARIIYEICERRRLPILFHTGHSDIQPPFAEDFPAIKYFRDPVRDFPNLIFIMGHSGIHQYKEAIELGAKHENVYLEVSGQPPERIKEMINGMGEDRILFGTDWAFYAIELPLAKSLIATEGKPRAREKILRLNAIRLLKEHCGLTIGN